MIDELMHSNEEETKARLHIRQGQLFVENGFFTEPGILEHMAQTAAAGIGHRAAQHQKAPPVGFIGAIKNWQLIRLPAIDAEIVTTVKTKHKIGEAHIIIAETHQDKEMLAQAEFTIFLQKEESGT